MYFDNLQFEFNIDRGGTFTDIFCEIYDVSSKVKIRQLVYKLLSENIDEYSDAPLEGIRRIMRYYNNKRCEQRLQESDEIISLGIQWDLKNDKVEIRETQVDSSQIKSIKMGTTVATNALLERKGANVALLITKGFRDLLEIGNQSRLNIFDLKMRKAQKLYQHVIEVDERVRLINNTDNIILNHKNRIVQLEDQQIEIVQELQREDLIEQQLIQLKSQGVESICIVLINSYIYNIHELKLKSICQKLQFTNISVSSEIIQTIKVVNRGCTTMVDAYLNPHILHYTSNFKKGFKNQQNTNIYFMQSDGGMTPIENFSILSGPAGGVVGLVEISKQFGGREVLGFDMGGTSSDVSRYKGEGEMEQIYDREMCGINMSSGHMEIATVAAGGGSRLFYECGVLRVGPESSGASPGPVCYGQPSGQLSVTDANLLLGRLQPAYFPKVFGCNSDQALDLNKTIKAFSDLLLQVNSDLPQHQQMTVFQLAEGFISLANQNMCRAIRNVTQAKGIDPHTHLLVTFGGAAAQHALAISQLLNIESIYVHKYSGILSAYGLSKARIVEDNILTISNHDFNHPSLANVILQNIHTLIQLNQQTLLAHSINQHQSILHTAFLGIKYQATDTVLIVQYDYHQDHAHSIQQAQKHFIQTYQQQFGFLLENRQLMLENIRVRSIIQNNLEVEIEKEQEINSYIENQNKWDSIEKAYFNIEGLVDLQEIDIKVYESNKIDKRSFVQGPCLIIQQTSTIVVEQNWRAYKMSRGILLKKEQQIDQDQKKEQEDDQVQQQDIKNDPIQLAIFGNRFMSIAEEMGKSLQRTSVSVNIKERLDFSCALFDSLGNLVANAPHLPVHLGSMSAAVQFQISYLGSDWAQNQVILSNHPQAGGSHLPDLTVISPVYFNSKVIFYLASRGHHSDIGGITPGSMPAFSQNIHEEGIPIKSFTLFNSQGGFREQQLIELLKGGYDPITKQTIIGSRNISDNISDLKAQMSANMKGEQLVNELIKEQGLQKVLKYMQFIQELGQQQVEELLVKLSMENNMKVDDYIQMQDMMDDGSIIHLSIRIDRLSKKGVFDFRQSSLQTMGNINCPRSVVYSAILYCLRSLISSEIPLNHGCLIPISVLLGENSLLNPSEEMAIVGGNVLTSQIITDLILRCFGKVANSYGCMNNFSFGDPTFGYYETICGGSGAGQGFHGQDAVQAHMTNTRITDIEVIETRYPVLVKQFQIRQHSKGQGLFHGGNGVIREFLFLQNHIQVSLLTERRVQYPQGIKGGQNAQRGQNILIKADTNQINIGSKRSFTVQKGDSVQIHTPGGAAYGKLPLLS